jgi:hypothetical protein
MASTVQSKAKQMILSEVRDLSPQPTELLHRLETKLSYREVQDALADLLRHDSIELGSDQRLRLTTEQV